MLYYTYNYALLVRGGGVGAFSMGDLCDFLRDLFASI